MKSVVAREVAAMLTILFPIKIVESILLKSDDTFSTNSAFLFPELAILLSLTLLKLEKAVSVAEKYADNIIRNPMENIIDILLPSMIINNSYSFIEI